MVVLQHFHDRKLDFTYVSEHVPPSFPIRRAQDVAGFPSTTKDDLFLFALLFILLILIVIDVHPIVRFGIFPTITRVIVVLPIARPDL